MRRPILLLLALSLGAAPFASAQVQVVPFPGSLPAPVSVPLPASVPVPIPVPVPVSVPVPTAPALPASAECAGPLPALHLAAADLAAGVGAYRAVTNRAGAPSEYRYWKVSRAQLATTLREVCQRGLTGYGTAPSGSLIIVLAARWPGSVAAAPPSVSPPSAPLVPAPSTPAQATPVQAAPAQAALAAPPSPLAAAPFPLPAGPGLAATGPTPEGPTAGPLEKLLGAINAARAQGRRCGGTWQPAAPLLKVDARLGAAAQAHAAAMVTQGFADHVNPRTGSTPDSRARAQGFTGRVSENIRYGTPTVDGALIWWLGSAAHCANLMSRDWTHVGAGSEVQNDQSTFWVLVLGRE